MSEFLNTFRALDRTGKILGLLAKNQTHVMNNISNVHTPNYIKQNTNFQEVIGSMRSPIEIELSKKLREFSKTLGGREQLAVEEFASSLEFIPVTLAENAGLDPIDTLTELKAAHESDKSAGINIFTGKVEDVLRVGIIEPLKIKSQAINSASEVAMMILRIDDVLSSGKGGAVPAPPMGGMPPGMGGMGDYD